MNAASLRKEEPAYPAVLRTHLGERAPERIFLLGNSELLQKDLLGLFCSIKCPGNVILKTYDLVRVLRDLPTAPAGQASAGVPVIGGFHTPMEKECLALLLRGTQPIVICPARSLERLRPSAGVKGPPLVVTVFFDRRRTIP